MFRLANFFLLFALVSSVLGSTVFKPKQCNKYGVVQNVKTLRTQFRQPKAFCNWYLSKKRTVSPNNKFTYVQFTKACECLAQKPASTQWATAKAPYKFTRTCKPAQKAKLIANFVNPAFPKQKGQPKIFCDFWGNGSKVFRAASPFMDMSNQQVYNACECYYNPATTTTSAATTTAASTSTTDSSAAPTTTSAATTSAAATTSDAATSAPVVPVPTTTPVVVIPTTTPEVVLPTTAVPTTAAPTTAAATSSGTTSAPTTSTMSM